VLEVGCDGVEDGEVGRLGSANQKRASTLFAGEFSSHAKHSVSEPETYEVHATCL
jgi:hypothetical protein